MQEINQTSRLNWALPLGIAVLCIALHFSGLNELLRFDRTQIDGGHWWLLLSCNFVHLGNNHLLMNLAGLGLIYFLLWSNFNSLEWLFITIFSSLGVGAGLYFLNPELHWYVGFSGTLHGLIIAGTIADLRRYPKSSSVLLVLIIAKLTYEQMYGSVPGSAEMAGGNVVEDSHLYGAIIGGASAAVLYLLNKIVNTN